MLPEIHTGGTLAFGAMVGLLASAELSAAQTERPGLDDVYSFGFDRCLEILRTQEPGDALRANRQQHPNSFCIGAGVGETDVVITICDDARSNPDAPTIQSCTVVANGELDVSARLDLSRWADRMQSGLAESAGIVELPPGNDRTLPRYAWCENEVQPFFVELGAELPGRPIHVAIYTIGASYDDPNPCEQE